MTLELFAHPFSSYCQKVLLALDENAIPFRLRLLAAEEPDSLAEWQALWPFAKMPVLRDGARVIAEASIIIEHLQLHHPGPVRLIPADPEAALEVRFLDRVFDLHVQTPMQAIVGDALRAPEQRDAHGVAQARRRLETAYAWLDRHLAGRRWAAGEAFTLADCAAAPALFYADWVQPIGAEHAVLRAFRARLNARPSMARAIAAARPFRQFFPLGAPDRD